LLRTKDVEILLDGEMVSERDYPFFAAIILHIKDKPPSKYPGKQYRIAAKNMESLRIRMHTLIDEEFGYHPKWEIS